MQTHLFSLMPRYNRMYFKSIALLLTVASIVSTKSVKVSKQEGITEAWSEDDLFFYGMVAGGFVSLIGFIAAFLLLSLRKVLAQSFFTIIIQVLFAFSCGALLGQTLHILPEAYASRTLSDQNVSLTFIAAILFFVFLERLMEKGGIAHSHWHGDQDEEENHNVREKRELEHQKGKVEVEAKQSTGFLNLFSSLLHNFIDGLAIGVAFSLGNPNEFLPVTIGIIAHQIPRQMGDVAILLKSKFNERETVISNGVVNLISLIGVYLGLNSHGIPKLYREYALVFVAGNFLYIASDIWRNLFHHSHALINLLEAVGLAMGVYLSMGHDHSH